MPEPLTEEQKRLVEETLPDLDFMLGSRYYRRYVRRLGYEDAYQIGAMALMHAARLFVPEKGVYRKYAEWWLRHYLSRATLKCGVMRDRENRISGRAGPRSMSYMSDHDSETIEDLDYDQHEEWLANKDEALERMRSLEPREQTILLMVSGGKHYHQIAELLACSRESVRLMYECALNKVKYGVDHERQPVGGAGGQDHQAAEHQREEGQEAPAARVLLDAPGSDRRAAGVLPPGGGLAEQLGHAAHDPPAADRQPAPHDDAHRAEVCAPAGPFGHTD